jgi:NHL repeat
MRYLKIEFKIDGLFFIFLSANIFLVGNQVSAQSRPAIGYVKHQILFLRWGSGNYEIGLKAINHGPTAMAVDRNENIYIADSENERIQVFSNTGKLIRSVSSDAISPPLEVDDNGDIFTTYNSNGKITDKLLMIKKDGQRTKYEMNYGFIEGHYLYSFNGEKKLSFGDNKESDYSNSKFNPHLFFGEDIKNSKKKHLIISTKKISKEMKKFGRNITSDSIEIQIPEKYGFNTYMRFLGFDNEGNVYYGLSYSRLGTDSGYVEPSIQKYSSEGEKVAEIPLDMDYCFGGFIEPQLVKVDKSGDVYQLLNTKSGVYVYKWIKN